MRAPIEFTGPPGGGREPEGSAQDRRAPDDPARDYRRLVEGVLDRLHRHLPPGARALVVSRGDDGLLKVDGRDAQHFPQTRTGLYAGYHPADGTEAVEHLEALRLGGAEYFVLPATAGWWLDHYHELRQYLEGRCKRVVDDSGTCVVYALEPAVETPRLLGREELEAARTAPQVGGLIQALLHEAEGVLLVGSAAEAVDVGGRPRWTLVPSGGRVAPSAEELLAKVEEVRAGGARYVALLKSERPSEHFDERVRRAVAERLRAVCLQRLVEVYELGETVA